MTTIPCIYTITLQSLYCSQSEGTAWKLTTVSLSENTSLDKIDSRITGLFVPQCYWIHCAYLSRECFGMVCGNLEPWMCRDPGISVRVKRSSWCCVRKSLVQRHSIWQESLIELLAVYGWQLEEVLIEVEIFGIVQVRRDSLPGTVAVYFYHDFSSSHC